jgi:NAD(P)-dependent dehydrogenase (short-subunit alcohol dehydrogenase family)
MNDIFSLKGKTILITGASSGIGRQCAIDCASVGAKVILVARDETRLQETISMLTGCGHSAYSFDLNNLEGIKNFAGQIMMENGALDGFIHAAGVEMTKPFKIITPADYESVMKLNTFSGLELARQFTSSMKSFNKAGSIIFMASITGIIARTALTAYSASKGALISASRVMAVELAKRNIRVNCISPGTILTPMMESFLASLTEEQYKARVSGFPLGLGKTTDISSTSIFLLSDASRWITGQNIVVDGGYTIQ